MKSILGSTTALIAVISGFLVQPSLGQVTIDWVAEGPANWNDDDNWQLGSDPAFVPNSQFDESARIQNGGTAQIMSEVPPVVDLSIPDGMLQILDGRMLSVDGNMSLGTSGGLQLDSGSELIVAGNATNNGNIEIADGATLDITGDVDNRRSLHWSGPGGNVVVGGNLSNSGTLVTTITSENLQPLSVGGVAKLGGSLVVDTTGFQPTLGQSWDLIQADSISGLFDSVEQSATSPALDRGLKFIVSHDDGSASLELRNALILQVNRQTGVASIQNVVGDTLNIKSYSVESESGLLSVGEWSSFESQGTSGWRTANPAATHLAELNLLESSSLAAGEALALGQPYSGQSTRPADEDLVFKYSTEDGQLVQGLIEYLGPANDLVLAVDPSTGQARLRNLSSVITSPDVKSYSILSPSGSLLAESWESLEQQIGEAGGWTEANPKADAISELNLQKSTLFSSNSSFDLGTVFDITNGQRDLRLIYTTVDGELLEGTVEYTALGPMGLLGDFDGSGTVDLEDFNVLKSNFGASDSVFAPGSSNGDGTVDLEDFNALKANFGSSASAAVPEPSSCVLALLAALIIFPLRFRDRRFFRTDIV